MNFIKRLLGKEYFVQLVGIDNVEDDQYMISNYGRIKRLYSNKSPKETENFLKGHLSRSGNMSVSLGKSTYLVGALMLYAFGKSDDPRVRFDFKDNNKSNLKLSNLIIR